MLRHITGHSEHPQVQMQKQHPHNNHLAEIGSVLRKTVLTLVTELTNSSGANRPVKVEGKSLLNLLLSPNL